MPVHSQDVPKTAVITPFSLFEFLRMPFGIKGAAQTFQRLMASVLRDMPFLFIYLDDKLVASMNADEYLRHLWLLFKQLSEHELIVNPSTSLDTKSLRRGRFPLRLGWTPLPESHGQALSSLCKNFWA